MPPPPGPGRGRASLWLAVALACFGVSIATGDVPFLATTMTYGNFDVPNHRGGIEALAPGVPDLARLRHYQFGPEVPWHWATLGALGTVFAVFLVLRLWGGWDRRLGVRRGIVQWTSFVLARIGVLRAANVAPVKRCTFGSFPFLNCQFCEMASGACPVGAVQGSLQEGRFPAQATATVVGAGAATGRWICGWFCPFGLFLDICEKATPRRRQVRLPHWVRAGKFVVLALLLLTAGALGLAGVTSVYGFCATICPAGSLYGLIPYYGTTALAPFVDTVLHFDPSRGDHWLVAGHLLFFAAFLVVTFRVAARFFCSALCPLGAALGLFARFSLVRVVHDDSRCDGCGACVRVCPTGIDLKHQDFLTVSDCIQCTRCIHVCPTGARTWSFRRGEAAAPPLRKASHAVPAPPATPDAGALPPGAP